MSDDSFYVVLPSNAQKGNTPSHFLTTLRKPIRIENSREWEVGLVDINLKTSIKTIQNDSVHVKHTKAQYEITELVLADGNSLWHMTSTKFRISANLIYHGVPVENDNAMKYFSAQVVTEGTVLLRSAPKSEEFYFEWRNGKVRLVVKSKTLIKIKISCLLAYIWGFTIIVTNPSIEVYAREKLEITGILGGGEIEADYEPKVIRENGRVLLAFDAHNKSYSITTVHTKTATSIALTPGTYKSALKLTKQFTNAEFNKYYRFEYDGKQNKMKLFAVKNDDHLNIFSIEFAEGLHDVLGFKKEKYTNSDIGESGLLGELEVNLDRGITNLFIYCDVCQHIRVGDTTAPLLRPVSINTQMFGNMVQTQYSTPIYIPINRSFIDNVEVKICDAAGEIISFVEGMTTLILHFRRKHV